MGTWIFTLPHWDPLDFFTKDIWFFLLTIAAIIGGVMICFLGYKYLFTLVLLILGCASGFLGMYLMGDRIKNPILLMFLFVMWIFLGELLFYSISQLIGKLLKERHIHRAAKNFMVLISPVIGATVLFLALFLRVYNGILIDLGIAVAVLILGAIYQKAAKVNLREFKTYDDLVAMKNPWQPEPAAVVEVEAEAEPVAELEPDKVIHLVPWSAEDIASIPNTWAAEETQSDSAKVISFKPWTEAEIDSVPDTWTEEEKRGA